MNPNPTAIVLTVLLRAFLYFIGGTLVKHGLATQDVATGFINQIMAHSPEIVGAAIFLGTAIYEFGVHFENAHKLNIANGDNAVLQDQNNKLSVAKATIDAHVASGLLSVNIPPPVQVINNPTNPKS